MTESTTHISLAENLFGLVETLAVFLSDSHKMMSAWMAITKVKHVAHNKLYHLQKLELHDGRARTRLCHL